MSSGHFEEEREERAFPVLKCLRRHYWRHFEPIPAQNALHCRILHTQSHNFPWVIPPKPCRSAPGAWTQTPISAWMASVPIVPVLRNDHSKDLQYPYTCHGKKRTAQLHTGSASESTESYLHSYTALCISIDRGASDLYGIVAYIAVHGRVSNCILWLTNCSDHELWHTTPTCYPCVYQQHCKHGVTVTPLYSK